LDFLESGGLDGGEGRDDDDDDDAYGTVAAARVTAAAAAAVPIHPSPRVRACTEASPAGANKTGLTSRAPAQGRTWTPGTRCHGLQRKLPTRS